MSEIKFHEVHKRLRCTLGIRNLVANINLHVTDLIAPVFITDANDSEKIESLPGYQRYCLADITTGVAELYQVGIRAIILFGVIAQDKKTIGGDVSMQSSGIVQQAILLLRQKFPDLVIIADVCLCQYTSHGHCGIVNETTNSLDNHATCQALAQQAISLVKSGADVVAPSACADFMVEVIREGLHSVGLGNIPIFSYAAKYFSNYYGPFRDAAGGSPQFGNRSSYQMDYRRKSECISEVAADIAQGADAIIIKPATNYLDVIVRINQKFPEVPIFAYHVSGEYAMLAGYFAARNNDAVIPALLETVIAMKRAGATGIITYGAKLLAQWLINDD